VQKAENQWETASQNLDFSHTTVKSMEGPPLNQRSQSILIVNTQRTGPIWRTAPPTV